MEATRQRLLLSRTSQEVADAELARMIAQSEGIDVDKLKEQDRDEEMARRLARELNGFDSGDRMPGRW